MGLPNHLSDIYLEELDKALTSTSEQTPKPAPIGTLLDPFISLMAQTPNARSDDEPSPKRIRRDSGPYSDLIANACFDDPQYGNISDRAELKKRLLRRVFEVASRPETKDASRRKMYALWKQGADEAEEDV